MIDRITRQNLGLGGFIFIICFTLFPLYNLHIYMDGNANLRVGWSLSYRLKYLNIYHINRHNILYGHLWFQVNTMTLMP